MIALAALRFTGLPAVLAFVLLAPGPLHAQSPEAAARGFSAAWASGDLAQLRGWFAESVRLTLDDRTRTGVRPDQTVAALAPLLERFEGPAPAIVRAQPMGPDGEAGFAELRWDARFRASGTSRVHTLLLTFVREGDALRVSDLRIVA